MKQGNGTNSAAVLILQQNNTFLKVHIFKTKHLDNDAYIKEKDYLLSAFKSYIESQSNYLLEKFEAIDTNRTGKFQ